MNQIRAEVIRQAAALLIRQGSYWQRRRKEFFRNAQGHPTGLPLSARFLADITLGLLAVGIVTGEERWFRQFPLLAEAILARQDPCGAFRWNLPDPGATHPDGVRDQVDLAMVVECLVQLLEHHLLPLQLKARATTAILRAGAYLETTRLPECPGIIRKRDYEPRGPLRWDVLNGDALAAKAFFLIARLPNGQRYRPAVLPFLRHLQQRFGKHQPGWWPYAEHPLTQAVFPPGDAVPSAFFQSMIILHLRPLAASAPFRAFAPMLTQAVHAVARAVDTQGRIIPAYEGRNDCRDKPNALTIHALLDLHPSLALARLRCIKREHLTPEGVVTAANGTPLDDRWRIWLFSDLARLLLDYRGGEIGSACRPAGATLPRGWATRM